MVEQLIERALKSTGQLFQRFDGWDRMAVFHAGNIATKQASTFFDVALRKRLCLAHFAQAVVIFLGLLEFHSQPILPDPARSQNCSIVPTKNSAGRPSAK